MSANDGGPAAQDPARVRNGAVYKKNFLPFTERVEVDGRLITGQNPQSARAVGVALLDALGVSRGAAA